MFVSWLQIYAVSGNEFRYSRPSVDRYLNWLVPRQNIYILTSHFNNDVPSESISTWQPLSRGDVILQLAPFGPSKDEYWQHIVRSLPLHSLRFHSFKRIPGSKYEAFRPTFNRIAVLTNSLMTGFLMQAVDLDFTQARSLVEFALSI
jgi:hypothetical protein